MWWPRQWIKVEETGTDIYHTWLCIPSKPSGVYSRVSFFLLYGRDAQLSTEATLITRQNWLEVLAKPVCTSQESPAEAEEVLWPTCKRVQVSSRRSCICVHPLWEEKEGEGTQVFPSISWPCLVPYTLPEYMYAGVQFNVFTVVKPRLKVHKGYIQPIHPQKPACIYFCKKQIGMEPHFYPRVNGLCIPWIWCFDTPLCNALGWLLLAFNFSCTNWLGSL